MHREEVLKVNSKNLDLVNSCELCDKASVILMTEMMLCRLRGVVGRTHCCKKFSLDPLKLSPRPRPLVFAPEMEQMTLDVSPGSERSKDMFAGK